MDKFTLEDAQPLLGLPWKRGADGPDEYDCWGLVKFCLQKIGISFKLEVDYSFPNGIDSEFERSLGYWKSISVPEDNCIVYGYKGKVPVHIGFVIDGWVLHSVGENDSKGYIALTKIKNFKRLYNCVRFYKWQR